MEQADLILRLLQDFRDETLRRFEQIDKRFEQIDKRFEQVDIALRELKTDLREVHRELHGERHKLDEVYEAAGITKIFS